MIQVFDVIIVGAGPAGSFLAYKLATHGMKVLLLERQKEFKRRVCGEYLCPLGVELLKSEGLEEKILGDFLPLRGMRILTANGTEVPTRFPYSHRYRGISVNRRDFDSNLLQLAKEGNANVLLGVEVKKMRRAADVWSIETSNGTFRARNLVGADGRASVVSKAFQNDVPTTERRVALHAYVESSVLNQRHGEMHLFPNGAYIGLNPTGEKEMNYSLVLDADELRTLGGPVTVLNHYLEKSADLKRRFPRFSENQKVAATFPIQHRTRSVIPARNVALIGDAAGFVDPLTGEGMYYALLSASILAKELLFEFHKELVIGHDALERYSRQYEKRMRQKIMLNRSFQWLIRQPKLVDFIARFLLTKEARANTFIGIVGNIYSPVKGILKLLT